MRTSMLFASGYMDKINNGYSGVYHEILRMSLPLFLHLVDELKQHGLLREGCGCVCARVCCHVYVYPWA